MLSHTWIESAESITLAGGELAEALGTHRPTFAQQQHPQPAMPEADPRLGQLAHPLPQRGQWIFPTAIKDRRARRRDDAAGPPCADGIAAREEMALFKRIPLPQRPDEVGIPGGGL